MKSSRVFTRLILVMISVLLMVPSSILPLAAEESSVGESDSNAALSATPVVESPTVTPEPDDAELPSPTPDTSDPSATEPSAVVTPTQQSEIPTEVAVSTPTTESKPSNSQASAANAEVDAQAEGEATVSLTVTMSDGQQVPFGTIVWLYSMPDNVQYGSAVVLSGGPSSSFTYPTPIPYGDYVIRFSHGQFNDALHIMVDSETEHFTKSIDPVTRQVAIGITMSDDGVIPVHTSVSLVRDADGAVIFSETFLDPDIIASTRVSMLAGGEYTLIAHGDTTVPGRRVLNQTHDITIDATDQSYLYLNFPLASASYSQLTVTAELGNGANIPEGVNASLYTADGQTLIDSISLPSGNPTGAATFPNLIQYGSYQLKLTGSIQEQILPITLDQATQSLPVQLALPSGRITVEVSMADAGDIPAGLTWSLLPAGSWDPIASGPVTAGVPAFEHEIPEDLPFGTYSLWITGNGYSAGQQINVQSPTVDHGFALTRLQGTLTVTVVTTDDLDIPAGTWWELRDASDVIIQSGTLAEDMPTGSPLPITNPLDFGVYTLNIFPDGQPQGLVPLADLPREWQPFTMQINMTNPWVTEYDITANLISQQDGISFTVRMSDDGPLPLGLEWSLIGDSYENPVASGSVDAGLLIYNGGIVDPVADGIYTLWVSGNGYSSGQVLNVVSPHTHHDFVLDRLYGNLEITVTTNDGSDIPVGTGWEILDANNNVLQSGILDVPMPSGGTLTIENPLEFGVYTLNIGENVGQPVVNGFMAQALPDLERHLLPFSTTLNITNPWFTEFPVTAALQWAQGDVSFTISMTDGGPVPVGLEWALVQDGSTDVLASGSVTSGDVSVNTIPDPVPYGDYRILISGIAYSTDYPITVNTLESNHEFTLERVYADVTLTLDTSNNAPVPAGTTWSITNSANAVIQQGTTTTAIADGGELVLNDPLEYGTYTLTVQAEGYQPASLGLTMTDPALNPYVFTVNLVAVVIPDPDPVDPATPEPTVPAPSTPEPATPAPATPEPATPAPGTPEPATPAATPEPTATSGTEVTGLPETGSGTSVGIPAFVLLASLVMMVITAWAMISRRTAGS